MSLKNLMIGFLLIALIVGSRLTEHVPNVAPVTAVALVAGVYLGKQWSVTAPLAGMAISDAFIGPYDWRLMAIVYGSFTIIGAASWLLRNNTTLIRTFILVSASSLFFFATTNLAVWLLSDWYPHTLSGLLYCYERALPFLKNTLTGDVIFSLILFGVFECVLYLRTTSSIKTTNLSLPTESTCNN